MLLLKTTEGTDIIIESAIIITFFMAVNLDCLTTLIYALFKHFVITKNTSFFDGKNHNLLIRINTDNQTIGQKNTFFKDIKKRGTQTNKSLASVTK